MSEQTDQERALHERALAILTPSPAMVGIVRTWLADLDRGTVPRPVEPEGDAREESAP